MPSPFPGMDPYLENPARWTGVHNKLIAAVGEVLTAQLRPHYSVETEERVYISTDDDTGRSVMVPDIHILGDPVVSKSSKASNRGDAATAVAVPFETITLIDQEIHEKYIQIVDAINQQVVTAIEILSPTNKVSESAGRQSYMRKRNLIMRSDVHLVEIDLLRSGEQLPSSLGHLDCDYMVHISRVWKRPRGQIWPIKLREQLPIIPIPLKKGDADATLDLQQLIESIYNRYGYDYKLDYSKDPVPKLSGADAAWAAKVLKAARAAGKKKR